MMTNRNWQDEALAERDGDRFLELLGQALNGEEVSGPHADVAQFAGALSQRLRDAGDSGAAAKISASLKLGATTRSAGIRSTSVERRFGVLNLAALIALLLLSAAVCSIWWHQKELGVLPQKSVAAEDRPVAPKPPDIVLPPNPELTFAEKLARPITCDFTGLNLDTALAKCRELGQIEIIADPKLNTVAGDAYAFFNVKDMELRNVLAWIAAQWHTEFTANENNVYIGHSSEILLSLSIYDVAHMDIPSPALARIIKAALAQDFAIPATSLEEMNGKLVVMQTATVQEEIVRILTQLREHAGDRQISFASEATEKWRTALEQRLEKRITFDYRDKPALEALAAIQAEMEASLIVAHEDAGLNPVSLHVTHVRGSFAFDWVARLCDRTYSLQNGAVVIGKPGTANPERRVCLYNVSDLATKENDPQTAPGIEQLIRESLSPDSWFAGLGTSIEALDGRLLVVQSPAMQKEIEKYIKQLRTRTVLSSNHDIPKPPPDDPVDVQKLKATEEKVKPELRE